MSVTDAMKDLAQQQELMKAFLHRLENHPKYSQDEYQELIFDLMDYNATLSVATDWVKEKDSNFSGSYSLKGLLQQQLSDLFDLANGLKTPEGQAEAVASFGMSAGDARRLGFVLEGVPEMNRNLQKAEDLTVDFDDPSLQSTQKREEKKGFLSRFFKK